MRITDALIVEHSVLRTVFNQVERIIPAIDDLSVLKSIGKMIEKLLQQHGDVEEHMLFVTLDHALANAGELGQMSQEHGEMDGRLRKIQEAESAREARRLLRAAMGFSRRHFENEEKKVFPLVHERLTDQTLKAFGEAWYLKKTVFDHMA